jgi:hypothetical protein
MVDVLIGNRAEAKIYLQEPRMTYGRYIMDGENKKPFVYV